MSEAIRQNRRKGPDLILRLLDRASVILTGILIFNLFLFLSAKPREETFFDRLLHISVPNLWDYTLLQLSLIVSVLQLILSLVYLYLNSKRLKRKDDRIRKSIVFSLIFSLILSILLSVIFFL